MSPRPYRLGRREAATEETRTRVLAAARLLLADPDGISDFSMDAVARQANVARMTIYYQFGSRRGLLEALFDDLAARGGIGEDLATAFQRSDPVEALDGFVAAFVEFWATDRLVLRRLRSLAALDPDFEQGVRGRDERRRRGVQVLLERLAAHYGRPAPDEMDEAADLLYTLTSFETFDALAGDARTPEDITRLLRRLALAALGLHERPDAVPVGRPEAGAPDS
jgi:AcrR family transcriptional regulator